MPSLLDPLPDEAQQLVDLVAQAYGWTGKWPVWQYVAQQAFLKHGIDAAVALRNLPQWQWPGSTTRYQAIRTVPGTAGNSSPEIGARTTLTIHGLFHTPDGLNHPLVRTFLKTIEVGADFQGRTTLSPNEVRPITIKSADLVGAANHLADTDFTAKTLGLVMSGEPTTAGGGVHEGDEWTWDLTQRRPLQTFISADARSYLVKIDALLATETSRLFLAVSPEALPRALDHLNVVWKAVTQQRLFYPRGLASAASLIELVSSGDQLTARLGTLADIFDLFTRTADGSSPRGGTLNSFRDQLVGHLTSNPAQDQARTAVGQLIDITRIRNGRLHTDATNWAESLNRLGVPASESPGEQWERIRAITVEAVYTIIELLQAI